MIDLSQQLVDIQNLAGLPHLLTDILDFNPIKLSVFSLILILIELFIHLIFFLFFAISQQFQTKHRQNLRGNPSEYGELSKSQ